MPTAKCASAWATASISPVRWALITPEQMAAISSQVAAAPPEPASRGGRGGGNASTRDIVANSGFDMGPSPLAGIIALGGFGGSTNSEAEKPLAQLASADKGQADALTARALASAMPAAPAAPVQAAAAAPVQTAGVIGSTPAVRAIPMRDLPLPRHRLRRSSPRKRKVKAPTPMRALLRPAPCNTPPLVLLKHR